LKNKILLVIVLVSLIISGLNVVIANQTKEVTSETSKIKETISFSKPSIETRNDYISLEIKETNDYLSNPGKPMLPVFIKTYKFPFGTIITDVDCITSKFIEETISGKIKLVPEPEIVNAIQKSKESLKKVGVTPIYQDLGIYPENWFDYSIKCGLDKGERTVFVILHIYPVRYRPSDNTIHLIDSFDVQITYDEPENLEPRDPKYDLLIISHRRFESNLQPLVTHKENMGISTTVKYTDDIYSEYSGRDKPEKIKYFIKYAIEEWDITYVILFGARNHQFNSFLVPLRHTNLEDRSGWNETYVSDLYYADIYKGNGDFEDWDSNGNDIFAEWTWYWKSEWNWWSNDIKEKDELDLIPDVYLGRIACKNTVEASTIVSKIINYETVYYNENWFKRMACFGGDTSIGDDGYNEGEHQNFVAASYMEPLGFEIINLWASDGTLVDFKDTIKIFNKGVGFVYMAGHGSPVIWCTHLPENETWVDGLYNKQMFLLSNYEKLPIIVIGGCHNSNYDVGFPHFFLGILKLGARYFEWIYDEECYDKLKWVPSTFSWNLMIQWGGAIATIGNTGLGWVAPGEGCAGSLDGWINSRFFFTYSELQDDENCTLGMVHGDNLKSYIQKFSPNTNAKHRKTVEQWALLGDPTLKIGGYPS